MTIQLLCKHTAGRTEAKPHERFFKLFFWEWKILCYYHLQLLDQVLRSANQSCLLLLVMKNQQPWSWWLLLTYHAPSCKVNIRIRLRKKFKQNNHLFFRSRFSIFSPIFCSNATHACHLTVKELESYSIFHSACINPQQYLRTTRKGTTKLKTNIQRRNCLSFSMKNRDMHTLKRSKNMHTVCLFTNVHVKGWMDFFSGSVPQF